MDIGGKKCIGYLSDDVSPFLKAWIVGKDTCVVGLIGEGTSMELVSSWNSPFEGDSLGGLFKKIGGVIQWVSGRTAVGSLASRQTWEGNQPNLFNLVLKFHAHDDPLSEVQEPLKALEAMMRPDVHEILPGGRIPQPVGLNIGRKVIYKECVITNMSVPLDKEKDKNGNLVRAEVALQIETVEMITAKYKVED